MKMLNRFGKAFVQTSDFTTSWAECGDADNMVLPQWGVKCFYWTLVLKIAAVRRVSTK